MSGAKQRELEVLRELKRKVDDDIGAMEEALMTAAASIDPMKFLHGYMNARVTAA